jgi:5-methylcytosine-specific restriction protein A
MIRSVTESQKKRVAGRQRYTCAASIPEYTCPMRGEPFDESGYEIDHIKELRDGGTNEESNLQALCIMCHRVKTSRMSSVIAKKERIVEEPPPPKLEQFMYKPLEITVKKYVNLCHHCHDQHNDKILRKEGDLFFCSMHTPGGCRYLGCYGKKEVHAKVVKPFIWTNPRVRD